MKEQPERVSVICPKCGKKLDLNDCTMHHSAFSADDSREVHTFHANAVFVEGDDSTSQKRRISMNVKDSSTHSPSRYREPKIPTEVKPIAAITAGQRYQAMVGSDRIADCKGGVSDSA